jgi:hypothetical protein
MIRKLPLFRWRSLLAAHSQQEKGKREAGAAGAYNLFKELKPFTQANI